MKKFALWTAALIVLLFATCFLLSSCQEEASENEPISVSDLDEEVLYVYNWGEYISDGSDESLDVNAEFERYCREVLHRNVTVNYSTFSSNEDMYAKVSSGSAIYDVIIPSDYMIQRMVREKLLLPLNADRPIEEVIPNYRDIDPAFKGENVYYEDDSDYIYSVPYFYGMVGVIYNTEMVPETEENVINQSWELMWDPDYRGNILQFNNSRDAFGTALYSLGYDVNEATEEQWREALELLKEQKGVVQGYVMDEIFGKMEGGSAAIAAYYAGDYLTMYEENDCLSFYYPTQGRNGAAKTNAYIDAMCIPKNARNAELAMLYINFMCSPEIGMANALYTYYASPLTTVVNNPEYREAMEEVHEDALSILYPDAEDAVSSQAYMNLSEERLVMLNNLWEELKSESDIGMGIYVLCGAIVASLTALVIYHVLKKRRRSKLYD